MSKFFVLIAMLFLVNASFANNSPSSIPNFVQVNENILRGGHPGDQGLAELKAMGVKTIIDLEDSDEVISQESATAQNLGFKFISVPLSGFFEPSEKDVNFILSNVEDPANYPVFIHCTHGQDRTGMIMGLYRVFADQWQPKAAYAEMKKLGFHTFLFGLDDYFREHVGLDKD